jgi:hypothetical protein
LAFAAYFSIKELDFPVNEVILPVKISALNKSNLEQFRVTRAQSEEPRIT